MRRSWLPIAAFLASCDGCSCQPEETVERPPAIAVCKESDGDVRTREGRAIAWAAMKAGAELRSGDWVQTGEASRASVEFKRGGALAVNASSVVIIRENDANARAAVRVAVRKGVVRGSVQSGLTSGTIELDTADGRNVVLSAAGSEPVAYRVTVAEDGRLEVAITEGRAELKDASGKAHVVEAGHALDVIAGDIPAGPVPLPAFPPLIFPGVDATVTYRKDLTIRMTWESVAEAEKYRLEIADDLSFSNVTRREVVAGTIATFKPKSPGLYMWRVASMSKRIGEPGFARRLRVVPGPIGTLLVGPRDGVVFTFEKRRPLVEFSWRALEPPAPYRLVVSKQANLLGDIVFEENTEAQTVKTRAIPPGSYYWGVFGDEKEGPKPLFTRPFKLGVAKKKGIRKTQLVWE